MSSILLTIFYKTYSSPSCRTRKHAPCRVLRLLFPTPRTTSPSLQPNTMACLQGHAIVLGCLPSPPTRKMCPIGHIFHVGLPSHPTPAAQYEKRVQLGTFSLLDCLRFQRDEGATALSPFIFIFFDMSSGYCLLDAVF